MSFSGSGEVEDWMVAMEAFIRSASEGPPKRVERALGSMGREEGGCRVAEGSVEVELGTEFSMDHFKRLVRCGS